MKDIDSLCPGQITFTIPQIRDLLLPNLIELREGRFPNKTTTGYTSAEYRSFHVSNVAKFVPVCEIIGELEARIERIPIGQLLIDKFTFLFPEKRLMELYRLDKWTLPQQIGFMLQYCKGRKRKLKSWVDWLASEKYARAHRFSKPEVNSKTSNTHLTTQRELEIVDNIINSLR